MQVRRVEYVHDGINYSFNVTFNPEHCVFEFSASALHDVAVQRAKRDHSLKYDSTAHRFAQAILDVITEDMANEWVPNDEVGSFEDLQEHCDGNVYLLEVVPDATERIDLCNEITDHLNTLLKERLEECHS